MDRKIYRIVGLILIALAFSLQLCLYEAGFGQWVIAIIGSLLAGASGACWSEGSFR